MTSTNEDFETDLMDLDDTGLTSCNSIGNVYQSLDSMDYVLNVFLIFAVTPTLHTISKAASLMAPP